MHSPSRSPTRPISSFPLTSAMLGLEHRLPMADSIILATARRHRATIWTSDVHFQTLIGVKYFPKK